MQCVFNYLYFQKIFNWDEKQNNKNVQIFMHTFSYNKLNRFDMFINYITIYILIHLGKKWFFIKIENILKTNKYILNY